MPEKGVGITQKYCKLQVILGRGVFLVLFFFSLGGGGTVCIYIYMSPSNVTLSRRSPGLRASSTQPRPALRPLCPTLPAEEGVLAASKRIPSDICFEDTRRGDIIKPRPVRNMCPIFAACERHLQSEARPCGERILCRPLALPLPSLSHALL